MEDDFVIDIHVNLYYLYMSKKIDIKELEDVIKSDVKLLGMFIDTNKKMKYSSAYMMTLDPRDHDYLEPTKDYYDYSQYGNRWYLMYRI